MPNHKSVPPVLVQSEPSCRVQTSLVHRVAHPQSFDMKGQQLSNSSSNSGTKSRKGATSIKGNLHTKSTPSSGKGKARTARSSSTSVASCLACGTIVTNDVRALQCDGYSLSTTWKCAECLNLTNNVYDQLVLAVTANGSVPVVT